MYCTKSLQAMFKPSLDEIKRVMAKKGYKYFSTSQYNLNIIWIRSENSESNQFDDTATVSYSNENNVEILHAFPCTTDPGLHWLHNPMNKNGTIIMVPGQYSGAYFLDYHNKSNPSKRYKALRQKAKMAYVRDDNRDSVLNFDLYRGPDAKKNIFWDICWTNLHRANKSWLSRQINKYSAGCQVVHSPTDFDTLINCCEKAISYGWKNSFTYTLLEEKDFR